jgi:hypothetical protein
MSDDEGERMAEAAAKLDSALEDSKEEADDGNGDGGESGGMDAGLAALLGRAETDVESLLGVLSGEESYQEAKDDIEDLVRVIEETEELLETVAVSELPDAVDVSKLPSAIEGEDVPEAIANAEPERAIDLRRLASLVEFTELWDAVDVRAFMQNKEELDDATDDVTDDEGEESGMMDSFGSGTREVGATIAEQGEAKQAAVQSRLRDAIEEFRGSALDARGQLKEARDTAQAKVEAKTGGGTGQPSSRNPTAYSTMVGGWQSSGWSSANFSTVPRSARHSSTPGHFRIYGRRFDERAAEEGENE